MKNICTYFLKGCCRYGQQCKNLHPDNQMNVDESKSTPAPSNTCKFFLTNSCNKQNCPYFHGYCNKLKHIKLIQGQNNNITNLITFNDTQFIFSDEEKYFIGNTSGVNKKENVDENCKIGKMIFSNNKVIFAAEKGE